MIGPALQKKVCIIGAGGFGKEVLCLALDVYAHTGLEPHEVAVFMVDDPFFRSPFVNGVPVVKRSDFDPAPYDCVVAIGDSVARAQVVDSMPATTTWATLIHPNVVMSRWVTIGEGAVVTAGNILTCNITIGRHVQLNLGSTVGHDCVIGDFFTTAPGVNISGNCTIGDRVYFGSSAAAREKLNICSDVVVGMGGIVVKHVTEPGVYVGNPAKRMER